MLIRQAGCHVRIFPKEESKIAIWLMILELKSQGWGLKRIASHLNALGIPSPGAGTIRTDPAVGTETFMLGTLRRIAETVGESEGEGAIPGAINAALGRLIATRKFSRSGTRRWQPG